MKCREIECSSPVFPTKSIWLKIAFLLMFFVTGILPGLYAYLDPGTGSFILQTLIAALFGALFVIKSYWQRIKSWFTSSVDSGDMDKQVKSETSEVKKPDQIDIHSGNGSKAE